MKWEEGESYPSVQLFIHNNKGVCWMTRLQPSGKEIIVSLRFSVVGGFLTWHVWICLQLFEAILSQGEMIRSQSRWI